MEGRHRRILLVEDDLDLRRLFRTALLLEGFAVAEAGDGVSALHLIEHETPDLIVLDIGLPTLSGVAVQQELAAQAHTQSVPILIVTGSLLPLEHLPLNCVLRKPVSPERLIDEVWRCLRRTTAGGDDNETEREAHVGRVLERAARRKSRVSSRSALGRNVALGPNSARKRQRGRS